MSTEPVKTSRTRIEASVEKVRGALVRRSLILALASFFLAMIPVWVLVFLYDYHQRPGTAGRTVELVLLAVVVVAGTFLTFWRAWIRRENALRAALWIEKRFPEFESRLVTSLQRRETDPGIAPGLYERLVGETETMIENTPIGSSVEYGPYRRRLLSAAIFCFLIALTAVRYPGTMGTFLSRVFSPGMEIEWPRRTRVALVSVPPRVKRGGALELSGLVEGVNPGGGRLMYRRPDGGNWMHAVFETSPDGSFEIRIDPVLHDLEVRAVSGDGTSETARIEAVIPPDVARMKSILHYPAYSRIRDATVEGPEVEALVGTRIELFLYATRPIVGGTIENSAGIPDSVEILSATLARVELTARLEERYRIRLYDRFGYTTDSAALYEVHPIEDRLPLVTIEYPVSEKAVTALAVIPLQVVGRDDFGVIRAELWWEDDRGERKGVIPFPGFPTRREVRLSMPWDLAMMELSLRDRINYRVVLYDEGEHPNTEPHGSSPVQTLVITAPDELRQSIHTRIAGIYERLEEIERQAFRSHDEVSESAARLAIEEPEAIRVLPEVLVALRTEEYRNRDLTRRTGQSASQLADLATDLEISHLVPPAEVEVLRKVAGTLEGLSEKDMLTLARRITELRAWLEEEGPRP